MGSTSNNKFTRVKGVCLMPMTRKEIKTQVARYTKFVLRVEPALHRRLAAKAIAAGESLNSFCVKTLAKA